MINNQGQFIPNAIAQSQPMTQPQQQPQQQQQGPAPQQASMQTLPYYGQFQQTPYQQPQSIEQSVHNNPQSTQNFLSALQKVGAGSNNSFMNAQGQQGQAAQAGFTGFGQNGGPSFLNPTNYQGYGGAYDNQLGSYANQASYNPNYGGGGAYTQATQGSTPFAPAPTIGGALGSNFPTGPNGGGQPTFIQQGTNQGNLMQYGPAPQSEDNTNYFGIPNPMNNANTASLFAPSDINSKENIKPADEELSEFLNLLGVHSYEYKNKEYGEGRRISPMAQEIEQSPLGKDAISVNENGHKIVNYGKLLGTMLSSIALVNHKNNDLKAQLEEQSALIEKVLNKRNK